MDTCSERLARVTLIAALLSADALLLHAARRQARWESPPMRAGSA